MDGSVTYNSRSERCLHGLVQVIVSSKTRCHCQAHQISITIIGGAQGSFPHDIKTQSGLTQLYNERVVSQEKVTRPLDSSGGVFNSKPFHHEGVL